MTRTIDRQFDPAALPAWARKSPAIVALAERNLAFRCDVFEAQTSQYRRLLRRDAEQRS